MDALNSILPHFLGLEGILSCQAYGNGHIHDTYRVTTATQNYILQRINHHIFKDVEGMMTNFELVTKHLQNCPDYTLEILETVFTKTGKSFIKDGDDNYWRCFPFIENTTSLDKLASPEQAYTIAHAFGTFIRALSDFHVEKLTTILPHFHDGVYRFEALKNAVLEADKELLNLAKSELNFIEAKRKVFKQVAKLKLPLRVVHNDTKANNILLDAESLIARCVIDLDTVMPGTVLSDFGDMVRICTNSEVEDSQDFEAIEMRKPIFEALQTGFLTALNDILTNEERTNLILGAKWLILEQACRFLTDFLQGSSYYKTEYPTHNLVRTHNQLRLYKSLVVQLG